MKRHVINIEKSVNFGLFFCDRLSSLIIVRGGAAYTYFMFAIRDAVAVTSLLFIIEFVFSVG